MKNAVTMWMVLPFMLIFMFQGMLFFKDSLLKKAADIALYEAGKEASIEGRFTQEIYDEAKQMLVRSLNFNEADIAISGTETVISRKNYIEATLTIPRGRVYVIPGIIDDGFTQTTITRTTRIMSEYIPQN